MINYANEIDTLSKNEKTAWLNAEKPKHISPSALCSLVSEPIDWDAIALKCSKNPKHEHYGKDPKEIRNIWKESGNDGMLRGRIIDDYIQAKLAGEEYVIPANADLETKSKITQFNNFYRTQLVEHAYFVGSEIRVFANIINDIAVYGRLDALFLLKPSHEFAHMIIDWKNTNKIARSNTYRNLLGPLSHLPDCEHVKYSLQLKVYEYVLRAAFGLQIANTKIAQLRANEWNLINTIVISDELFIETLKFAFQERIRRENK